MGIRNRLERLWAREKDFDPDSVGPRGTKHFESRAGDYLADPDKTRKLLDAAHRKGEHSSVLEVMWDDLQVLFRMIRAYVDGNYRTIPWIAVLTATAAVLYFVSPVDFVPEFLIGIGLLDDAAVLAWTLRAIQGALNEFREWEKNQPAVA